MLEWLSPSPQTIVTRRYPWTSEYPGPGSCARAVGNGARIAAAVTAMRPITRIARTSFQDGFMLPSDGSWRIRRWSTWTVTDTASAASPIATDTGSR